MAFDLAALSTWNDELGGKADYIMSPILASKTLSKLTGIDKRYGIKGNNVKIPKFESTAPWQSGTSCGYTTSGTTTISQLTLTTVPIQSYEEICLKDLEGEFTQKLLPDGSKPESFDMLKGWTDRKMAKIALQVEQALWQSKTTYTNSTVLKHFNGFISTIDSASDEIIATGGGAGTALTTSNVRTTFEEIVFDLIPSTILDQNPVVLCGYDTFRTLVKKLMIDDSRNFFPGSTDIQSYELIYPGTNIKVVAIPGLNNNTSVDTGVLPAAVKNRIIATTQDNLLVGMAADNDLSDFKVWYSEDDDKLKFIWRTFLGVQIKYTDLVTTY